MRHLIMYNYKFNTYIYDVLKLTLKLKAHINKSISSAGSIFKVLIKSNVFSNKYNLRAYQRLLNKSRLTFSYL